MKKFVMVVLLVLGVSVNAEYIDAKTKAVMSPGEKLKVANDEQRLKRKLSGSAKKAKSGINLNKINDGVKWGVGKFTSGVKGIFDASTLTISTDVDEWSIKDKTFDFEYSDPVYTFNKSFYGITFRVDGGYGLMVDYLRGGKVASLNKWNRNCDMYCPPVDNNVEDIFKDEDTDSTPVVDNTQGGSDTDSNVPAVVVTDNTSSKEDSEVLSGTRTGGTWRFLPYVGVEPTVEWKKLTYGLIFGAGYQFGANSDYIREQGVWLTGTKIGYTFKSGIGLGLKYLHIEGMASDASEDKVLFGVSKAF